MKAIKPSQVKQCLVIRTAKQTHLLVQVKKRGWFMDTRYVANAQPSTKAEILQCLAHEGPFKRCLVQRVKL